MVNSPLIRPYLLGGVALGGGTLGSHEFLLIGLLFSEAPSFLSFN